MHTYTSCTGGCSERVRCTERAGETVCVSVRVCVCVCVRVRARVCVCYQKADSED